MIEYVHGSIFDADVEAVVNTVNTEGVMGKGLALQFKARYPEMFVEYQHHCQNGFMPGEVMPVRVGTGRPAWVLNFATKDKWRQPSELSYILKGLVILHHIIEMHDIKSLAIPPLGCGLGGLRWADVKPLIEKVLGDLEDVRVIVYEPK